MQLSAGFIGALPVNRLFLAFFLLAWATLGAAQSDVRICYGYGCLVQVDIHIEEARWQVLGRQLRLAVNAENEREILAGVVGQFYAWAAEQSPVGNDRGGNYADAGVHGAMDCIDHSTSTTNLLRELERRQLLRWHQVLPRMLRARFFVFEHYSAAIAERVAAPGVVEPSRYAVDSWFVDNGKPAVILPLEDWMNGAGPDV